MLTYLRTALPYFGLSGIFNANIDPQVEIEAEGKRLMPELKEINSVAGPAAFLRGLGFAAKADHLYIPDFGVPDSFKKILEEFYWNLPAYDWEKLVG